MTQSELIILNFTEIRRKSIKLWKELPKSHYNWKPDEKAMTAIEMIRHVLEADYGWNIIINNGSLTDYKTPWENRPFVSVSDELEFAEPYRQTFLESVNQFSDRELNKYYSSWKWRNKNSWKIFIADWISRICSRRTIPFVFKSNEN